MNKMTELKPCPFCGSEAEVRSYAIPTGVSIFRKVYTVTCSNYLCWVKPETRHISGWTNRIGAIEYWNRRTSDDSN